MNKFKKVLVFFLVASMLIGTNTLTLHAATVVKSGTFGNNASFSWSLDDTGTLTITGEGDMPDYSGVYYGHGYAPWIAYRESIYKVVLDERITSIGDEAFINCEYLTSIDIPEGVTSIGNFAFYYCESLPSIDIPDAVTYIGEDAFNSCNTFVNVEIPSKVTAISKNAFANCVNLKTIVFPDQLTTIGMSAFFGCTSLEAADLPANLKIIDSNAFYGCIALESVSFPKQINTLGNYSFANCTNLTEVTFFHEAADTLSLNERLSFYNSPVSTVYVTDKNNVNATIRNMAEASSQQIIFKNIIGKYIAGISEQEAVSVDDVIEIIVSVDHDSDTTFNAGEIQLTFDNTKLEFNQQASTLGTATVKVDGSTLILEDYGADKALGNAVYTLAFTAKEAGDAVVTMTSAAFADSADALKSDLIAASISPATVTVTINKKNFTVTLPDIFEGPSEITDGEDYTFSVADGDNYNYDTVTATMNGLTVTVIDNGDGTYTIENVTGPLVISGTRIEKTYQVTLEGTAAEDITDASDTATYNTDYTFTLPEEDGWVYSVESITIGGREYTGYAIEDGVCTIAGTAICGDIVITVSKEQTTAGVTVEGTGAGAAAGYETSAVIGEDYILTIVPEEGYDYTVTATVDGEAVEVIDNGDNTYTVKAVTGALVFTVNRTVIVSGVTVEEYLSINGSKMWLVKNDTEVEDGKVPTYDGEAMFWSEQYDAYCYLVIAQTLSEEEAAANVGIVEGDPVILDNGDDSKDVNGTGKVDANDAQLVYDMYNARYTEFTADVTMEKFLRADVNGIDGVTVEDAAAIIDNILGK